MHPVPGKTDSEWRAIVRHAVPFFCWITIMSIPMSDPAIRYALQTAVSGVVLLWARPWTFYPPPSWRHVPVALMAGIGVFVMWVVPELPWVRDGARPWYDFYMAYGVRGGASPVEGHATPFAPSVCGWGMACVRWAGSAVVIAVAEEFFWRGFLMRWMQGRGFITRDPRQVVLGIVLLSSCLFGLEHSRWLVGIGAGLAYAFLYRRTGDLCSVALAHGLTNALLGGYVLRTGSYGFW